MDEELGIMGEAFNWQIILEEEDSEVCVPIAQPFAHLQSLTSVHNAHFIMINDKSTIHRCESLEKDPPIYLIALLHSCPINLASR